MTDELIELEERGWTALSSGPSVAQEFYDEVLDSEVIMLFPGGMTFSNRDEILEVMGGAAPWAWFRLEETRTWSLGSDAGLITYRATAQREGSPVYSALMSSVYVRRGNAWKMVSHQQTPV